MRFDDRLSTVLQGDPDSERGRVALWQQMIDLLAQDGNDLPPAVSERGLRLLARLHPTIPAEVRTRSVAAIAPACRFSPLIVLLSTLDPRLAHQLLPLVRLDDGQMLPIIPELGPVGRAVLRERDDLSPRAQQALRLFAAGDLVLPQPAASNASPAVQDAVEIRDLVKRIEEYRQRRTTSGEAVTPLVAAPRSYRFVADVGGRIVDVEQAPRGRFVGLDLASPARATEAGSDAAIARRFAKRAPIAAGRLRLTGDDEWAGLWLCDAEPQFARADGGFVGYVGSLRRPRRDESVEPIPETASAPSLSVDLVRQLMHELRSPLNAISGYAQMIEGQFAGPVAEAYRLAARAITSDAQALQAAIDELDLLARPSPSVAVGEGEPHSLQAMVARILAETGGASRWRIAVTESEAATLIPQPIAPFARIVALLARPLAGSGDGNPLPVRLGRSGDGHGVSVVFTAAAASTLATDDSGAPVPGLGFAFAAARRLAMQHGGSIDSVADQYILNYPAVPSQESAEHLSM